MTDSDLPRKRGRPPKPGGPTPTKERTRKYRASKDAAGLRKVDAYLSPEAWKIFCKFRDGRRTSNSAALIAALLKASAPDDED